MATYEPTHNLRHRLTTDLVRRAYIAACKICDRYGALDAEIKHEMCVLLICNPDTLEKFLEPMSSEEVYEKIMSTQEGEEE